MDFGAGVGSFPLLTDVGATSNAANSALAMARWSRAVDHFMAQSDAGSNGSARYVSAASMSLGGTSTVSWKAAEVAWQEYSNTAAVLTPVPEPSTYGAILLGAASAWVIFRRSRLARK